VHDLSRSCAEALLPAAPAGGHEVTAFAFALPLHVVGRLLGLGPAALPEGVRAAQQLALALSPLATHAERAAGAGAAVHLDAAIAQARGGPLLEALRGLAEAEGVAPAALRANAVGLLLQTCEATAGLIGNTLVALGRAPGRGVAELGDAELGAVLEEVLRLDPPVQNTRRYAASDLTLLGERLAAGQEVLVLLAAANRDAAAPPLPGCPRAAHLTFGLGAHACPGAALARSLAAAAVARVLAVGVAPEALARSFHYRPSLNGRIPRFTGASACDGGRP
jgi:cytochrome P450